MNSRKIRVLHLVDHLHIGGCQELIKTWLKHRDAERFDVSVATLHGKGYFFDKCIELGTDTISFSPWRLDPIMIFRAAMAIRRIRPDVLHTHLVASPCLARLIRPLTPRARMIVHVHNEDPLLGSLARITPVYRFCVRNADLVCAVSRRVQERAAELLRIPAGKIRVLFNTFDPDSSAINLDQGKKFRKALGIPDDVFVVGCAGRLFHGKGFHDAIHALQILRQRSVRAHLLLLGSGSYEGELRSLASRLRLDDRVTFAGFLEHAPGVFPNFHSAVSAMDAFLLPSHSEGFPVTVLEIMHAGLPVISTRVSGIADNFTEEHLMMAENRNPEDLARKIGEMILLPEAGRKAMAGRAMAFVKERFMPAGAVRELEDIYRGLL